MSSNLFSAAALMERKLRAIPPGKAMDITRLALKDVTVPADMLDPQTPEFLVEWFRARLPFPCTVTPNVSDWPSKWTFYRPADERAKADMAAIKSRETTVREAIRRRDVEVDIGPFGLAQLGLCPVVSDANGGLWILRGQKLVLAGAVE